MKQLFKVSNSYCTFQFCDLHIPEIVQRVCLSTLSENPSDSSLRNSEKSKNQREIQGFAPLFNEIVSMLGTENISVDKSDPYRFLMSKGTKSKESVTSAEPLEAVCENAQEKIKTETLPVLGNSENWVVDEIGLRDVSPIVHKITEIVRGGNAMEERLEDAGFEYDEEIVDKVLKRCFKVPRLGLRFFNWVKLRKGFAHTTGTFNTMINVAGEAEELALTEELVEDMEKSACEKNVKTWTLLVSHYGKAKLIGRALLMFEKMRKSGVRPDAVAYRIMLCALCDSRKSEIALEFYKEMIHNEVEMDMSLYKKLLKCFALSGDVAAVRLVGNNMIQVSEIPEPCVYALMLKSFCIAGRITEALELIRDMKNKDINLEAEIFETLVKGFCSANRVGDAMEIVEILQKRNVFDRKIYGVLISTCLRRNEVCDALDLFQEMKDSGDVPISIYTNLMQHLFWKNEIQKGMELYNEMIEMRIELDSVAITAVAVGYVRQNQVIEAWEVFKSMDEKGVKASSKQYRIFIKELCKVPKTDEHVKVFNEMQFCKVNISDDIFTQFQAYLEKKGGIKKIEAINMASDSDQCDQPEPIRKSKLDQVEQRRMVDCLPESASRCYSNHDILEICNILSSSGNWCLIQQKLEKGSFQCTPESVVKILRNCRLNGGIALKFFSWVGKQPGYAHSAQSYNMAIKIAGQGKDFKHMISLFHEMRRRGYSITSDTWTVMIMQYGRTGLTDIALRIFKEMKLSGCEPTKSTYNSLITSLCEKKGRNVDEAIQIYQEMARVGYIPDKELVETYVGCLCEVNKLSDAKNCIGSLQESGFSVPLAYSLYFRALCRSGKLEDALALADEVGLEKSIFDQYTYGSLIHSLLRSGRAEEALAKIESMKEVGISPTVHVYTALIIHYFKDKAIDKALETLEEMKEQGCQPTVVTYSALICGYVRTGKVADAWNVFHHLKQNGPSPDFKTYSMFIDCLCRVGKSEEALKLVSDMLDTGIIPSTINFRRVMYGLNREGKPNLAKVVLKKKLDLKQRRKMHVED